MERRAPRPSSPKQPGGMSGAPSPSNCHRRQPPHTILFSLTLSSSEAPVKRIKAVYPGSFDPPTNGHLDLIERGSKMFEQLVVAVLRNSEKTPMFSLAERLEMLRQLTADWGNVRIDTFDGLMVEYAKSIDAMCVL